MDNKGKIYLRNKPLFWCYNPSLLHFYKSWKIDNNHHFMKKMLHSALGENLHHYFH